MAEVVQPDPGCAGALDDLGAQGRVVIPAEWRTVLAGEDEVAILVITESFAPTTHLWPS